ncbi:GUSB [Symbiodinium sp. CCMP2456]|nr:GUSB [Symbiodinium sp. CCMP2456]
MLGTRLTIWGIRRPASRLLSRRWLVVMDSSCFQHLYDHPSYPSSVYGDDPLARINEKRRGMLLESFTRSTLERMHPELCSEDAVSSLTYADGSQPGSSTAEWDFTLGGRRVELKTAMLCFDSKRKIWRTTFTNVKLGQGGHWAEQPFDDLYLLIYTPEDFYLIKHDLATGIGKAGVATRTGGHAIRISGASGQTSWQEATDTIVNKLTMKGACELVGRIAKTHSAVSALYTELQLKALSSHDRAYDGVPMSNLTTGIRAKRIQQIALEFDKMRNPDGMFESAAGEPSSNGSIRRGSGNAAVDWIRNGVRVEVKYAKVCFRPSRKSWSCEFCNIKEEPLDASSRVYFDELWLAMYSPCSLDIFKHAGYRSQLLSRGVRTERKGKNILVDAGRRDSCVENAVRRMQVKLEAAQAEPLLTLRWNA